MTPVNIASTIFRYRCDCGVVGALDLDSSAARCTACGHSYSIVPRSRAIVFATGDTEQNEYFDTLYRSEKLHKIDDDREAAQRTFANSAELARAYLTHCGIEPAHGASDMSILDVACGSGWVTAGLISHPTITRCRFHACDISADGLELLAHFQRGQGGTNMLELSVQNAEAMVFEDSTFDIVIGSSVLHHFNDVPAFLCGYRRILTDRGVAVFGEPFALGYGIGAAVLMLAQTRLGRSYDSIAALYHDLKLRITGPRDECLSLVDKHLFFQSAMISTAREAGFSEVSFVPFASRDFYRESFIDELLAERQVVDSGLARTAKEMYRVIFDLFDADSYAHSLAAFNQVILRV